MLSLVACGGGSSGSGQPMPQPPTVTPDPVEEEKPNILLIMVDDLGFNDLAINNDNKLITTPNLDQLAKDGVRFTRHYATAVCSPARAALLTGQDPVRNGYVPNGRGLSPQLTTLPEALKAAGYKTWHIGKWHIGDLQRQAWPDYQGFDHWFGFLNQWRLAGKQVDGEIELATPRYLDPWLESDTEPGAYYSGHLENILTDKTIATMDELQTSGSPWFINLWFYAPHTPIQPAAEFAEQYPDTDAGRYKALVHQLDHNIGRVLDHLDSTGQRENTIVVVVSDNGGTNKQIDNNFPYHGRKASFFEGGLRTPLIIQWPKSDTAGTVFDDVVSVQDIFPTLLESIELDIPADIDGQSLFGAIHSPDRQLEMKSLFWEDNFSSYGILSSDSRWRLYKPLQYTVNPVSVLLFDLESDPFGAQEIIPVPAEVFDPLFDEYRLWHRDVHRVKTTYEADDSGLGTLTGMDFLRTPGFGAYTFGISFTEGVVGTLAQQGDIWQASLNDGVVIVSMGDNQLSGVVETRSSCHSVVISGLFTRRVSSFGGDSKIKLSLYIDGLHQQTLEVDGYLDVKDPGIPIDIGWADSAAEGEKIFPPVILSVPIDSSPGWTAESFAKELCST
jgi:arylsulfatase A-like enzyme